MSVIVRDREIWEGGKFKTRIVSLKLPAIQLEIARLNIVSESGKKPALAMALSHHPGPWQRCPRPSFYSGPDFPPSPPSKTAGTNCHVGPRNKLIHTKLLIADNIRSHIVFQHKGLNL